MQGFGAQPVIVADCELQVSVRHNILDASSSEGSRPLGVNRLIKSGRCWLNPQKILVSYPGLLAQGDKRIIAQRTRQIVGAISSLSPVPTHDWATRPCPLACNSFMRFPRPPLSTLPAAAPPTDHREGRPDFRWAWRRRLLDLPCRQAAHPECRQVHLLRRQH